MEGMKNFETFDQFLDATQDLLFPIPQGEKKSDYHGEGWNACYARMEKLVETENENSMLRDLLQNRMPAGAIAETTYQPILDENEELKETNEKITEENSEYIAANHELEKEIKQLKEQIEFLKNEKGLEEWEKLNQFFGGCEDFKAQPIIDYVGGLYKIEDKSHKLEEENKFLKDEGSVGWRAEHLKQERSNWAEILTTATRKLEAKIQVLEEELACVTSQRDTFGDMIKSKN
jgi:FtsZ-binding cell division protein ZapB